MTDLVVISLEVWDEVWRRNQHLIAGLLRAEAVTRVLFVEPPVDVTHNLLRRSLPEAAGLRQVAIPDAPGELWALRPRKTLPRRVDPTGDRRRAHLVKATAQSLGMTAPVLWINDPGGAEVLSATGWPALYDITDDWLVADRPARELERLRRQEALLFADCREVIVCSRGLRQTKSVLRDVTLIPNAVDIDSYRVLHPRPDHLPTGRVAMYLGTAHRDRIDVDLCMRTARQLVTPRSPMPSTFVFVGPAPLPQSDLTSLRDAGVQFLGQRPSEEVPAYLQHADVLVVPHVLTEFTASLDPIKAYEYRAARRPVVATKVPGFALDGDTLQSVVSKDDFPRAVAHQLTNPVAWSPPVADDIPTWDQRVAQMETVIRRVAKDSKP